GRSRPGVADVLAGPGRSPYGQAHSAAIAERLRRDASSSRARRLDELLVEPNYEETVALQSRQPILESASSRNQTKPWRAPLSTRLPAGNLGGFPGSRE